MDAAGSMRRAAVVALYSTQGAASVRSTTARLAGWAEEGHPLALLVEVALLHIALLLLILVLLLAVLLHHLQEGRHLGTQAQGGAAGRGALQVPALAAQGKLLAEQARARTWSSCPSCSAFWASSAASWSRLFCSSASSYSCLRPWCLQATSRSVRPGWGSCNCCDCCGPLQN
jgi:hypothetical protein